LKRGEKGSDREHMDMQRFKAQTLKEEIEALESQKKDVQGFNHDLDTLDSEKKEKASVASKIGFKGKETVELPKETYEKLYELASNAYSAKKLQQENAGLQEYKRKYLKSGSKYDQKLDSLEKENRNLRNENKLMHKTMGFLKKEGSPDFKLRVGYNKMLAMNSTPMTSGDRVQLGESGGYFVKKDSLENAGREQFIRERKEKQKKKNKGLGM